MTEWHHWSFLQSHTILGVNLLWNTFHCILSNSEYLMWLHAALTYPESSAGSQPRASQRTSRVVGSCPHTPACQHWCRCGWGWPPLPGWLRSPGYRCFGGASALDTPPRTLSCQPEPLDCRAGHWGAAPRGHRTSPRRTRSPSVLGWTW